MGRVTDDPKKSKLSGKKTLKVDGFLKDLKGNDSRSTVHTEVLLRQVIDNYHTALIKNPQGLEDLKKLGIKNSGIIKRFQLGYAAGDLAEKIGQEEKQVLKELGILKDNEEDVLKESIIFPIRDEIGTISGLYPIGGGEGILFSTDPLLINYQSGSEEIIITESPLELLSWIEIGFEETILMKNGVTETFLKQFREDRVRRIILTNPNESLKKKLEEEFSNVITIQPEGFSSWNNALISGVTADQIRKMILKKTEEKKSGARKYNLKEFKHQIQFVFPDIIYKVTGGKEHFSTTLRLNIRVEQEESCYIDKLDLYSARSRSAFTFAMSENFGIEPAIVQRDLYDILEYFETRQEMEQNPEIQAIEEMTEEDKKSGMDFLMSTDLFREIVKDMEDLGYVGEEINKELLYLCASSRKMDDPISVLILSESASGKSYLVETVRKLIPPEDVIALTSLSDQALSYVEDFKHKFLLLGEAQYSSKIDYQIREMLSGKELSRLVTQKDEKTGKTISRIVKTPVIVASVMSSTDHDINPENASRSFICNTDESIEQTRRIHEAQRKKYSLDKHFVKEEVAPKIIRKHHAAQRLLQKRIIINPLALTMDFPAHLMRSRRDHDRFMDLISVVCYLRQYQKDIKKDSKGREYIECDLTDYGIARNILVNGILTATQDEFPKRFKRFYEAIRQLCQSKAKRNAIEVTDVEFTQQDVRRNVRWTGSESIKKNLKKLCQLEYLMLKQGGGSGQRNFYSLVSDEPLEKIDFQTIPTVEILKTRMKQGIEAGIILPRVSAP